MASPPREVLNPMLDGVIRVRFQDVVDSRGRLTAVESGVHVPFDIARVFYVHEVAPNTDRGGHAHRDTDQVLSCVAGRMKVDVCDGGSTTTFELDDASSGILVPRMHWTRLYDFSANAVLAVYANTVYDRSRSIRTWEEYTKAIGEAGSAPRRASTTDADDAFLDSALADVSETPDAAVEEWLRERQAATTFRVTKIPLQELRGWRVDASTGNVVHESGKFFRVVGIEAECDDGPVRLWRQPVIDQPEVGILGFLTQRRQGVWHFLVQAKMEPGNVNLLQLSPTLQATRSNFTQVHGGRRPRYLEYFLNAAADEIVVDQLQSEQGTKFLRKRNRNIIVHVPDNASVPDHEDFRWLTLAQLNRFLRGPNAVNMDSRTVLAGIQYGKRGGSVTERPAFMQAVMQSLVADDRTAVANFTAAVHWLAAMRVRKEIRVRTLSLRDVDAWLNDGVTIQRRDGRYFSVVGVRMEANTREVGQWDQPLIESAKGGIICLLCQRFGGTLHFLMHARAEAGNFDSVEIAPTLEYTPVNYGCEPLDALPKFVDVFGGLRGDQIRYDSLQSEEGGRFYHDQNRYMVAETDPGQIDHVPADYHWMTMRQLKEFIRFSNCVNVETRSLIACLGLAR